MSTLLEVGVDVLQPSPDNPRRDLGDLSELAATIEAHGVIEPLIVNKTATNGLVLVSGHRRLAAAQKIGLATVPCVVVEDMTDVAVAEVRLVENLQRVDLSPMEEAAGFAQLVALGRSQRDIARIVGKSQPHVSKRLALLKLPEVAHTAIESGDLTIEDAIAAASLPTSTTKALFAKGMPDAWEIRRAADKIEEDKRVAAVRKELTAAGVTIVDKRLAWSHNLREVRVDEKAHAAEPCHVVYLSDTGRTETYCTEPKRHAAKGESTLKKKPEPKRKPAGPIAKNETAAQKADRLADPARREAAREAEHARETFAAELLAKPIPPNGWTTFVATMWAHSAEPEPELALELLGKPESDWNKRPAALAALATDKDQAPWQGTRVMYALALAEGLTTTSTDRSTWGLLSSFDEYQMPTGSAFFEHLVDQGYELAPIERWLLGEPEPAAEVSDDVAAAHVVTVTASGKKWRVVCSCGDLDAKQTTEVLAEQRRNDHLRDAALEEPADA